MGCGEKPKAEIKTAEIKTEAKCNPLAGHLKSIEKAKAVEGYY